ncbi:Pimeloyl-ACP methyl ester carboxylesterase [Halopenitus malekzadehii]|uniref:Pimeloyl-ACP methyl ester carboxylesterase n=1 Tax=Halopenitus malekzadehii TaxID=1267564 RepID=A0A1H6HR32_9EURY|nr:alpha/beta hydrolase [Halopenitus malekzadehii]SEH38268.1 Pimeloyl-ACP methyl ester carboxylesterase [Halopenitus malekzadehii]
MAYAVHDSVSIRYAIDGSGPAVVFVGDIGLGAWQFAWQHGAVAGPYSAITPEPRGIGRSDAPTGPYTINDLTDDVTAVLADAGIRSAHLAGYGLGGLVAMATAMDSTRVRSLVLIGTPTCGDAFDIDRLWADPADRTAVEAATTAILSDAFRRDHPDDVERIVEWRTAEDASPDTVAAHRAALADVDLSDRLHELTTPTLVVHGTGDTICSPDQGQRLADGLPRGTFRPMEDVGHFAGIEASGALNDALLGWLVDHADRDVDA